MKYVDIAVSVLCLGAGALAMFTGIGIPFGIAVTVSCAGYGIGRSVQTLVDRSTHGQTINPFADWDAFNAWAGIAANAIGFGLAGNAIRLSANISEMAAEGLRIANTTELALRASIYIPQAINGGLMAIQFYQLVKYWDQIPVEHKIIIGLQFIFFAAASYKIGIISVNNIEDKVLNISYDELSNELARQVDPAYTENAVKSLRIATDRVGGVSVRAINFFKKLISYRNGELIAACVDEDERNYIPLTEEGNEIGFELCKKYFTGPEPTMDIADGIIAEQENQPGPSTRPLEDEYRLPANTNLFDQEIANRLAEVKRFIPKEKIEAAKNWLEETLNVSMLEDYEVNGTQIFKNIKYHDQIRIRVFEDIGKSLNEGLIRTCIRFAEEGNAKTVGQFASDYEIASLQIHKEANYLASVFEKLNAEQIRNQYKIETEVTTETRLTYPDLANERGSSLLADELNKKALNKKIAESISNISDNDNYAKNIYDNWHKQSESMLIRKTIANTDGDVHALANEVINAGEISYPNADYQAINAAKIFKQYPRPNENTFATDIGNEANAIIQSCQESVETRVFEVTRQKEKLPIRRLIFWNLDHDDFGKSVMVAVNTKTGEVYIQNFLLKKTTTTTKTTLNPKTAIMDHWNTQFDYDAFKVKLTGMINTIKGQCEEYVGHSVIRSGLDHDSTVSDIQNLKSVRFASIEQAICHVIKHGENLSNENLVAAVKEYFNKAQEIIQYSKDHPENVSSSWTQTGSARDFVFYRKSPTQKGVEKVVVLIREGGEVILKTYFYDDKFTSVPVQQKHSRRPIVDIKHANLLTFYFQLMLIAPHYGVLLPKDYELFNTEMDEAKTRTIIIMAGHYFEDGDTPNTLEFSKALKHAFPINKINWNVVAIKVGSNYSFDVFQHENCYMYCRVKTYRFVIFAPKLSPMKTVSIIGNKQNYTGYAKQGTVVTNHGFNNDEVLDLANRICSYTDRASEITKALREVFGGCWSCMKLSNFVFDLYFDDVYLRLTVDAGNTTCAIFPC